MADPDPIMKRLGEGFALAQSGEREAGRRVFAEVWEEIGGERGDPFHRCALAHWMADYDEARHHLLAGQAAVDALPDDGYGRMISAGLQRLAGRLPRQGGEPKAPQ